jgi:TRAP-type C4-dicarboxylate transport system permease small subunit
MLLIEYLMHRRLQPLSRLTHHIGGVLFVLLFLDFIVQIVARFFFDQPLPWSDEAAVILYVWIILWACALMVPEREHVVFDLIWNAVSARGKKVMTVLGHLMVGVLSAIASCLVNVQQCWIFLLSGCIFRS